MSGNASFSNNHSHILGTSLPRINHVQKLYILFWKEMRKSDIPRPVIIDKRKKRVISWQKLKWAIDVSEISSRRSPANSLWANSMENALFIANLQISINTETSTLPKMQKTSLYNRLARSDCFVLCFE